MQTAILVGDIGSTKSTWWYSNGGDHEIHLNGFNPLMHTPQQGNKLFESLSHLTKGQIFSNIWYYGTGVISELIAKEVKQELSRYFPDSEICVQSDLVGAAIAANGKQPGTIAILGTGSHAAVWNGEKITRQATSLGYILGDEGGGSDIGKSLIQAYFYNTMPDEVKEEMKDLLPDGRAGFFEKLRASASPNQFLASFVEVAVHHKENQWMQDLMASRLSLFIERHLAPLKPEGPIHIIGSIGAIFADLLTSELKKFGFAPGQFIRNPSHKLFESHISNE